MLKDWNDLFNIVKGLTLTNVEDSIVWNYESKGLYTVKSLYNIVNFRGICSDNIIIFGRSKFLIGFRFFSRW